MVDLQKGSERKGKDMERNTCAGYGLIQRHRNSNPETSTTGTSATTIDTGKTIVTSKMTSDEQQTRPKTVGLSALRLALLVNTRAGGEDKLWGDRSGYLSRRRVEKIQRGVGEIGRLPFVAFLRGFLCTCGTRDDLLSVQLYTLQA